ncbi:MAG: hypothetical protein AB1473_08155 [Thermodesulfobacteriota bacterium]
MRLKKLKIFTVFFIILVLIAAYVLGLLRTYVFKPPPSSAVVPCTVFMAKKSNGLEPVGCSDPAFRG